MYDSVIIGGGIIGLSIARSLALKGYHTLLLEANKTIGQESSFRNSAVLHAGIYYPKQSLKAKLCVRGKLLMEEYCKKHKIPYKSVGKLIVVENNKQIPQLLELKEQGESNKADDLILLEKQELKAMEPAIEGVGALYSPHTAIIDGQVLLESLKQDFLSAGGTLYTNTSVCLCKVHPHHFITYTDNLSVSSITSKSLINATGLWSQKIASTMVGLPSHTIPPLYLAKGNYFKYLDPVPFRHLIYPLPETAGLGIHATIDIDNHTRFGPDVEWITELNFKTNEARKGIFLQAIKKYFPTINERALVPDTRHTGIRPKILPPSQQPQDFLIQDAKIHGIDGLVQLYGIDSPGLTASFAIAEVVSASLMS